MKKKILSYTNGALKLCAIILVYTIFFQLMYCWMKYGAPIPEMDIEVFGVSLIFNFFPFLFIAIAALSVTTYTSSVNKLWKKISIDLGVVTLAMLLMHLLFPIVTGMKVNWGGSIFNTVLIWLAIEMRDISIQKQRMLIKDSILEKENDTYRYQLLQSYVNPHFLSNMLEILCSMIEQEEKEEAISFITKLSAFYRGMLKRKSMKTTCLSDELNTLENYLAIAIKHYGDTLTVKYSGDKEKNVMIVPFSVQLLVENVLKHNIISESMPLEITIDIHDEGVTVANPCHPKMGDIKKISGLGLTYLKNMYAAYGKTISVENTRETFVVTIPFL